MRRLFAPVFDHLDRRGLEATVRAGPRLMAQVVRSEHFAELATSKPDGTWDVHDAVRFPDPAHTNARWLTFSCPGSGPLRIALDDADWRWAHDLVSALSVDGIDDSRPSLDSNARTVLEALRTLSMLDVVDVNEHRPMAPSGRRDITFLGHNAVVVESLHTRVIVDPFFFAADPRYPPTYQPLTASDVGAVDAVLVTHSHPDHFDSASLLRFSSTTPVVVPQVERESILCVDMALRLRKLGFTDVRPLEWGSSITIGELCVSALPFYGEQPSGNEVLHPEVRNWGNTYVVATPTFTVALLADAGCDHLGDIRDVATTWTEAAGTVDIVFSGYRGWDTYPVQLLFSSVAPYLLFMPPSSWNLRHRLMNDATDAVDAATRMGARYVVPYGDGGAPWHWLSGLGPHLDGGGQEDVGFDPFPQHVVDAARALRTDDMPRGRAIDALLLHPGDMLLDVDSVPRVTAVVGHAWPFGP